MHEPDRQGQEQAHVWTIRKGSARARPGARGVEAADSAAVSQPSRFFRIGIPDRADQNK
jgi:hypothetical protein